MDITDIKFSGLPVTCQSEEFSRFNPPSGQTCLEWAGDFIRAAGGYLDNPSDSSDCRYCQYAVSRRGLLFATRELTSGNQNGDDYYTPLNIDYSNRWRDVWIVFCFFGTYFEFFVQDDC